MRALVLPVHAGLAGSSRLPVLAQNGQRVGAAELLVWLAAGVAAALASALVDLHLRIPGHAIIRAVFPMALGLALAPRRMAGTVMGATALASAWMLRVGGLGGIGIGAITSLALTGPFLDLALWRAGRGWRLYAGFALAGAGANLIAFMMRAGVKMLGLDHAAGRPLGAWWPQAIGTYVLCGAAAGIISAFMWFQLARGRRKVDAVETAR